MQDKHIPDLIGGPLQKLVVRPKKHPYEIVSSSTVLLIYDNFSLVHMLR